MSVSDRLAAAAAQRQEKPKLQRLGLGNSQKAQQRGRSNHTAAVAEACRLCKGFYVLFLNLDFDVLDD